MRPFKNILVLQNSNQAALTRAIELAQASKARVTVVDVVKKLERDSLAAEPGLARVDIQALVVKELSKELKQTVADFKQDKLRITSKVLVGSPSLEIIREVIRNKHDLVVMVAEGRGGLREQLFGSTSLHLMRACPCPVLVVKPTRRTRSMKILAAVDVDPNDATKRALNTSVLNYARLLADTERAQLHIVHAWTFYGEALLEGPAGMQAADARRLVRQEAARRRQLTEALASQLQDTDATLHVVKGEAADVIPRVTKSEGIDVLVMGTVCRTGVAGFLIGNTAETVINRVDCAILAIKPAGFVSPVVVEE